MIIVAFEANGIVNTDMFTAPDAKVFNRGGFIEVTVNKEMVAAYNPAKFIVARKISQADIEAARNAAPDSQAANKNAEGTEHVEPVQPLHPVNGAEGQQDSPDRGSTG